MLLLCLSPQLRLGNETVDIEYSQQLIYTGIEPQASSSEKEHVSTPRFFCEI